MTAAAATAFPGDSMKRIIKNLLAHGLYFSGLLHLYKRLRLRGKAVVLMYHRVLPAEDRAASFSNDAIIVEPATFDRHLRWLRRHFRLVGVDELSRALRDGGRMDDYPCLITFDDGWEDNYRHAYPLLKKHAAPAVIFLPVDYIGTGRLFWQERMGELLFRLYQRRGELSAETLNQFGLTEIATLPASAARAAIKRLVNRHKARPYSEIDAQLEELQQLTGDGGAAGAAPDRYFDWEAARTLQQDGIDLGSHASSHRILPRLSVEEVRAEVSDSKARLEKELGRPVRSFAYPNGDYDDAVAAAVRDAGFDLAFTTERGTVAPGDPPFRVRRVNIHEEVTRNGPLFLSRVLGLL